MPSHVSLDSFRPPLSHVLHARVQCSAEEIRGERRRGEEQTEYKIAQE